MHRVATGYLTIQPTPQRWRQESHPRYKLRRLVCCPLHYGGICTLIRTWTRTWTLGKCCAILLHYKGSCGVNGIWTHCVRHCRQSFRDKYSAPCWIHFYPKKGVAIRDSNPISNNRRCYSHEYIIERDILLSQYTPTFGRIMGVEPITSEPQSLMLPLHYIRHIIQLSVSKLLPQNEHLVCYLTPQLKFARLSGIEPELSGPYDQKCYRCICFHYTTIRM